MAESSAREPRPVLWRGDNAYCPACGIEVRSALMAAMCAHRESCEFWPSEPDNQDFLDELGMRLSASEWPAIFKEQS